VLDSLWCAHVFRYSVAVGVELRHGGGPWGSGPGTPRQERGFNKKLKIGIHVTHMRKDDLSQSVPHGRRPARRRSGVAVRARR
jgi:hypothetical protein